MLRENLQNALKEAMKNHDTATVSAVRLIIARDKRKKTSPPAVPEKNAPPTPICCP